MITFIKETVLQKVRLMSLGHLGGNRFFINMGSEELFKMLCCDKSSIFSAQPPADIKIKRPRLLTMRCNTVSYSCDVG